MAKSAPANQRRVTVRANTDLVNRLNALDPGLGSLYAADVRRTSTVMSQGFSAASGQRGTVKIVGGKRDSTGNIPRAVEVDGPVAGGKGYRGDEFMTRDQIRGLFTCERFGGHPSGFPGWFEECVEDEQATAGAGVMPYFFGWTVHIPPEADTLTIDPFTGTRLISLWSFVLPAPATVARLSYYMQLFVFTASPPTINIGMFDVDFNLIFETGGIDVSDPSDPTQTEDGAFTFELDQEYELEAGEYFMAISSGSCIRMIGIATSSFAISLLDHAEVQDEGLTTPGPYGLRMFEFNVSGDENPYDGFPATLDASTGSFLSEYEDGLDCPMVLFEGVKAQYG